MSVFSTVVCGVDTSPASRPLRWPDALSRRPATSSRLRRGHVRRRPGRLRRRRGARGGRRRRQGSLGTRAWSDAGRAPGDHEPSLGQPRQIRPQEAGGSESDPRRRRHASAKPSSGHCAGQRLDPPAARGAMLRPHRASARRCTAVAALHRRGAGRLRRIGIGPTRRARAGRAIRANIRTVIARGGDSFLAGARLTDPTVEEHDGNPIDVLTVLSEHADLVVVGSRGLHGIRALGSVSERVAHQAHSPVLVVRGRGAPDPYPRSARR